MAKCEEYLVNSVPVELSSLKHVVEVVQLEPQISGKTLTDGLIQKRTSKGARHWHGLAEPKWRTLLDSNQPRSRITTEER